VYAEASTVLRPVRITVFGKQQCASTFMRKTLDWKRSRISVFEMETVPHCFIH
jgi:hypothetical protein